MPIYEYECELCHFHFERKQGFHEEPIAVCPECQGKVRRVIHSSPVIFKGSGFYVTDNRKPDTPTLAEAVEKMPTEKKRKGKKG